MDELNFAVIAVVLALLLALAAAWSWRQSQASRQALDSSVDVQPLESTTSAPEIEAVRSLTSERATTELAVLDTRLAAIESALPSLIRSVNTGEVNDAILLARLESVESSLKRLEKQQLTRWDVATSLFALLSAISVVTGAIFAGFEYWL